MPSDPQSLKGWEILHWALQICSFSKFWHFFLIRYLWFLCTDLKLQAMMTWWCDDLVSCHCCCCGSWCALISGHATSGHDSLKVVRHGDHLVGEGQWHRSLVNAQVWVKVFRNISERKMNKHVIWEDYIFLSCYDIMNAYSKAERTHQYQEIFMKSFLDDIFFQQSYLSQLTRL